MEDLGNPNYCVKCEHCQQKFINLSEKTFYDEYKSEVDTIDESTMNFNN
jgi:hypothetical protein